MENNNENLTGFNDPLENKDVVKKKGHGRGTKKMTAAEVAYIQENYLSMSDEKIAVELNRNKFTVRDYRKKNGWTKRDASGKKLTKAQLQAKNDMVKSDPEYKSPVANLGVNERKTLFLNKFNQSTRGTIVKKTCTTTEQKIYKDMWCSYLESVDSLTTAEEETLHQLIMNSIFMDRFREEIKIIMEHNEKTRAQAIKDGNHEFIELPINPKIYDQLNKCEDNRLKLEKQLNVSREQRLKQKGEVDINFVSICRDMIKREARKIVGQEAAIIKFMKDEEEKRLRDNGFFIGGDV